MIELAIARRYARALLELGKENQLVDDFLTHFVELEKLCQANPQLRYALSNRYMDFNVRLRVLESVLEKLGSPKLFGQFLRLVLKKGRFELLGEMVQVYQKLVYEVQNKAEAVVVSAHELDDSFCAELKQSLQEITGKEIVLKNEVKSSMLGGLQVQVSGKVYDGTLNHHLEKIKSEMLSSL